MNCILALCFLLLCQYLAYHLGYTGGLVLNAHLHSEYLPQVMRFIIN